MKPIETINRESFAPYGTLIDFTPEYEGGFQIVVKEPEAGWRLAVLRFNNRTTDYMENHPESMESFEPVSGVSVIIVAENGAPEAYRAFLLDQPVCLHKGVWHQVIALSERAVVKIAENFDVSAQYHRFAKPVGCFTD